MNPITELSFCPRCNDLFDCRPVKTMAGPNCNCGEVELGAEALNYIAQTYPGCLCLPCLIQVKRKFLIKELESAS